MKFILDRLLVFSKPKARKLKDLVFLPDDKKEDHILAFFPSIRKKPIKGKNNSGIILLVVLWLLVILSLLAIGIGRRTSIDLSLTKHGIGKLKAEFIAWAGFAYAQKQLMKDAKDNRDTLYQCGFQLEEDQLSEDLFREVPVGEGYFEIRYDLDQDGAAKSVYGLKDAERKININALTTVRNTSILKHLLLLLDYDEETSQTIAASVKDWRDADSNVTNAPFGAEEDDYIESVKYHCKNMSFDTLEELLLVKGMTPEILKDIREYLTIFPKNSQKLTININTAPPVVIRSLGYGIMDSIPNITEEDVDGMASKLVEYRRGADGKPGTEDDNPLEFNNVGEIGFSGSERTVFLNLRNRLSLFSQFIEVKVFGFDGTSSAQALIDAVIDRQNSTVLYWRRN